MISQNKKVKQKGRPNKVMCYDNGIVILLCVNKDQKFYYVKNGKLFCSKKFPVVGKKVPWFSLPLEQREGVLKYYERIWAR